MIKNILNEEHGGFSGLTHWLIAIMMFFLMWLIPLSFSQQYVGEISKNIIFAILIFFIVGGSSLLPDLDSSPLQEGGSTAVYQLGIIGYLLSIIAITLSGVVYAVLHTRYDQKPKSQHRMLWHAMLIPVVIFLYVQYAMPLEGNRLIEHYRDVDYYSMFILVFFAGISVYLGCTMLFYRLFKLIKKQNLTQILSLIIMVVSIVYMLFTKYDNLRLIGIALALGYAFHIFGDLFTKGGAPVFFPIPIPVSGFNIKKLQLWRKPKILGKFSIETGGTVNLILNFALFVLDIFLVWFIFFKK